MIALNGNRHQVSRLVFALIDALLILTGLLLGIFLRVLADPHYVLLSKYLVPKILLKVFLIQMAFYYFDLYDSRIFSERKKTLILLIESLVASGILLAFLYYVFDFLEIGRGVFFSGFTLVFLFTFSWRLAYGRIFKSRAFRERVLIVGTGPLARKISREITENGYEGFEIVGFVDENRERIGDRI